MPHEHLPRPPIVEALLDFRVHPSVSREESADSLDRAAENLEATYPSEVHPPDLTPEVRERLLAVIPSLLWARGRRFRSEDGRRTVLISHERLTFSLTFSPPTVVYTEWEDLEQPAFAAWDSYARATEPLALVRLATRFVNRITVPLGGPTSVFRSPPDLPIPDVALTAFSDRRSGLTPDGYGVQTGRRLDAQPAGRPLALFVDVEAYRAYDDAPLELPVLRDDLMSDLARLRDLKNDLFHSSLTHQTLDRYRDAAP